MIEMDWMMDRKKIQNSISQTVTIPPLQKGERERERERQFSKIFEKEKTEKKRT
jgi:hypothetical protein